MAATSGLFPRYVTQYRVRTVSRNGLLDVKVTPKVEGTNYNGQTTEKLGITWCSMEAHRPGGELQIVGNEEWHEQSFPSTTIPGKAFGYLPRSTRIAKSFLNYYFNKGFLTPPSTPQPTLAGRPNHRGRVYTITEERPGYVAQVVRRGMVHTREFFS